MRKKRARRLTAACVVVGAIGFCWYQNNAISVKQISFSHQNIPSAFAGYRILHLSDLHGKLFGEAQRRLLQKIRAQKPDCIFLTGDLVNDTNMTHALTLLEQLAQTISIYFVPGNHEKRYEMLVPLQKKLTALGVTVLDDSTTAIEKDGQMLWLSGVKDPTFYSHFIAEQDAIFAQTVEKLREGSQETFQILLTHRPEYVELYDRAGFDLVFAGHAHGGQFRLPFVGAVWSPGQGFRPTYTDGLYTLEHTSLVVSRGLGNSVFPQRLLNLPQLIVVTLQPK